MRFNNIKWMYIYGRHKFLEQRRSLSPISVPSLCPAPEKRTCATCDAKTDSGLRFLPSSPPPSHFSPPQASNVALIEIIGEKNFFFWSKRMETTHLSALVFLRNLVTYFEDYGMEWGKFGLEKLKEMKSLFLVFII